MTKAEAITKALDYGLAIYKNDTAKTIAARVAQHEAIQARNAAEAAAASASFAAKFARYTVRRIANVTAFRQMALPLHAPRNWAAASGTCGA
jgi:hypothetical protein